MEEQEPGASEAVLRAREDLEGGREWQARDRLAAWVAQEYDEEALELLGEVYAAMRDLPAAGAAWFGTKRRGEDVEAAVAAWRERHDDRLVALWSSLPPPVREHRGNVRVEALRRRLEQEGLPTDGDASAGDGGVADEEGADAAVVIGVALGILFVVCAVVGFVTLMRWIVPGV